MSDVKELPSNVKEPKEKGFIGTAIAAVTNATQKQSIDTSLPGLPDPIEETDNTMTYVLIALVIMLMGGTAFYFISKKKES